MKKKLLAVAASLAVATGSLAFALPAVAVHNTDGLAGYWNFDDSSANPTLDSSGHGNSDAISGAAAYTTSGIAPVPGNENALTFDGVGDYVAVAHDDDLDMTGAYSISAWVNVTDIATYRPIAFRGTTNSNDIEVYVQSGSGDLIVAHNRGNAGTFDYVGFVDPPAGLFHLTVTYDGTDVKAYYNDALAGVAQLDTAVVAPVDSDYGWWLGKVDHTAFGGTFLFKGLLDEVRIYDRALILNEIEGLADAATIELVLSPEEAINEVGTEHTVTATLDPTLSFIPVNFSVTGLNATTSTVLTDENGQASFTYTGTNTGPDSIIACIDADNSGACDVGEPTDTVSKTWFVRYFVTGGGNIKDGKKPAWTYGGTVGKTDTGEIVGNFTIVDHANKRTCHLNDFDSLEFTGDSTESPVSEKDIATFVGSGSCNGDTDVTGVTVEIHDEAEPGAGADTISVSGGDLGPVDATPITGGNFQVHPPEEI